MSTYIVYANNEEVVLSRLRELGFEVFHPSTRRWPDVMAKKNGKLLLVEVKTVHGNGFLFPKGQLTYLKAISDFLEGQPVVFLVYEKEDIRVITEKALSTFIVDNREERLWLRRDHGLSSSIQFLVWYQTLMKR